jgi:hypothetical protein
MKKSNKLLLGGFLAVVLLISAIHITLYAKYKAGDYTVYHQTEELPSQSFQTFPQILFVSVRDVAGATVRFSDVAQVEKADENDIQYVQKGDTLLITGKRGVNEAGMLHPMIFHLPSTATLSLLNSTLSFAGSVTKNENNPVIYLEKSTAVFSGAGKPLQFGHVKVVASNGSTLTFKGNTQVDHLEVQLLNSSIEYSKGNPGQLSIVTDSLSHISLSSNHLLKANIKTFVPE